MHIALITVGAPGHVLATLAMVTELVRRNVRVTYFTSENFREMVCFTGADFIPVDTVLTNQGKADKDIASNMIAELPLRFLSEADHAIKQILPVLEKDRPDAIVTDQMALAGRLAAKKLGLPLIQIYTSYAPSAAFSPVRNFPPVPDNDPARMEADKLATRLTEEYGVEHLDLLHIFESLGDLNIVAIQKKFHPMGETYDDRYVFVGAQIAPRGASGTWQPPENGLPLVYASLGTLFNSWTEFYVMLGQAVKGLPINLLTSIGSNIKPEDLGELPENMTVASFLPQLEVLQHTDLFITHAGTGSVMEAIYFGVPMLGIPQMDEQILTAVHIEKNGLGKAIIGNENVTVEGLRKLIIQMLENPQYKRTLQEFKKDMEESGGYAKAADAVMGFVSASETK